MKKEYINRYFDLLKHEAEIADYSQYPYPDMIRVIEVEKIEAARKRKLAQIEEENGNG